MTGNSTNAAAGYAGGALYGSQGYAAYDEQLMRSTMPHHMVRDVASITTDTMTRESGVYHQGCTPHNLLDEKLPQITGTIILWRSKQA